MQLQCVGLAEVTVLVLVAVPNLRACSVNLSGTGSSTTGPYTLSARSSGEDRVDIVLCCVTQQGQGSGVEVKGMTAKQLVKPTHEFLHNLSYVISTMEH